MAGMSLIEKTLDAWNNLPLDKLDDDTVKYYWDNAFVDVNEVGSEAYKQFLTAFDEFHEHLLSVYSVCDDWITDCNRNRGTPRNKSSYSNDGESYSSGLVLDDVSNPSTLANFSDDTLQTTNEQSDMSTRPEVSRCELWEILAENNIPVKKIMTLLYILLSYGNSKPVNNEKKDLALLSARIYFVLLRIPGSGAFRLFQSNIFSEVFNTLRLPTENVKEKKKKNSKTGKKKQSQYYEIEDDCDDQDAEVSFDIKKSLPLIAEVLEDFTLVIHTISLRSHPLLVDLAINVLATLSQLETEAILSFDECLPSGRHHTSRRVGFLAFKTILAICNRNHGSIDILSCTVMKYFLPNVLMSGAGSVQTIQKQYQTIKDNTIVFLKYFISVVGENGLPAARIFLQHISTKSPDRAEFRVKIAQSVISLLEKFPQENFDSMLEWYQKLCRAMPVNYRIFTLELFSLMIIEHNGIFGMIQLSNEQHRNIVRAIVERCGDKASSVQSKALSIIAHYFAFVQSRKESARSEECSTELLDSEFIQILREHCCNEKVNVRKSAIQVLEQAMCIDRKYFTCENLKFLKELCRDIGLMARKQAIQSLNACFLSNPDCNDAWKFWVMGIFPVINDRESSIQEKCLEILETVLLQNLSGNVRGDKFLQEIVFKICESIADGEHQEYQPFLRKIIHLWARNGKIKPNLVVTIKKFIGSQYNSMAWLLLVEFSACEMIGNPGFALSYWEENKGHVSLTILHRVLQTILHTIKNNGGSEYSRLHATLLQNLRTFNFPTELIRVSVEIVEKLDSVSDRQSRNGRTWCSDILDLIESYLTLIINGHETKQGLDREEEFVRHIFTLGVLSQISEQLLTKKHYNLVQTVIACSGTGSFRQPLSELPPSQVRPSQIHLQLMTTRVQAHAFVTLGKMCLQNEDYAKQNIVPLVRELQLTVEEPIKNNILIILSDLCIRYPTLVDPYINNMTACIQDKSLFVRKQALSLVARLLQEDYIKCRGPLFYQLLTTYVDSMEEIRALSQFVLLKVLLARNALVFYHHFIESIFCLNCYLEHRVYNKFYKSEEEAKLFALAGPENEKKRSKIYKFLLENMDDENKFRLNLRISQEILAAVTDDVIPLSQKSVGVIQDALHILCSEEIKLNTASSAQDEIEDELLSMAAAQTRKNIVSQVVKKNIIENIIPIVVSLKHLFESKKSVLLRDLMLFLRELLKDYKNEIKDILTDKQLAKEIEFDMRQFNEREAQRNRNRVQKETTETSKGTPAPQQQRQEADTDNSVVREQSRTPIKPENRCYPIRASRAAENMEVDDARVAVTSGPIEVDVDNKPQDLQHTVACDVPEGGDASITLSPIVPTVIKRTVSCDEVPQNNSVASLEALTISSTPKPSEKN